MGAAGAEMKMTADEFYTRVLNLLVEHNQPFLIGGGFALKMYTGIERDSKDIDIFCKASDYPHILKFISDHGFRIEQTDVRWLAKIFYNDIYIDLIFNTTNNICIVDDTWFHNAIEGECFGVPVKFISAEDLFWCKAYVQNRERFDGADVNHLMLKWGRKFNWDTIAKRFDQHWQILLSVFLMFQFVYPTERDLIPKDLFMNLITRASEQYDLPVPVEKVCRGPVIDQTQYETDIKDWNYKAMTIKTV
jgi:predicted nucleotidyltransferase